MKRADMPVKLTIHQLQFERHEQFLLEHLNVTLQAGELLQVRGANGSGKSTLLRMIAGFIEPHAGVIEWQGQCIFRQLDSYQQQLKYVGHQNGTKPTLTVYENLRLYAALTATPLNQSILSQVLEKIGLQSLANTLTHSLSAGQLRRLSLARLFLNPAPLWILDEPVTALDNQSQDFFRTMLLHHLSTGGIAIVATHHELGLSVPMQTLMLGAVHE